MGVEDEEFGNMMDGDLGKEPPPTTTVRESVVAIAIALGVFAVVVLVLQVHYIASLIGEFTWIAATIAPGLFVANYVYKMMAGFRGWARMTVGTIIFFTVALFIGATLEAHHHF